MTTKDHGKEIAEFFLPGDGHALNTNVKAGGPVELRLSATFHGDHDEFWIVLLVNGDERERYNTKFVSKITWKQP